jgi:Tol biopolymer transport system component
MATPIDGWTAGRRRMPMRARRMGLRTVPAATVLAATVLAVTLLAAGLSVTALTGAAQAAYPGNDGLIAFVRSGDIFTINPAHPSGSLVKLTSDGRASGPRWSPNGSRIAYLDGGNLWVMDSNGSHKKELTSAAPRYLDSRPTWSPNGKYLAFVRTAAGKPDGYLTRYTVASRALHVFTTTMNGHLIRVAALAAPVAWAWAATSSSSSTHGSYLAFEGAAKLCAYAREYCLDLLGFPAQSGYSNGYPSAEHAPTTYRLTDPDWYPVNPLYYSDLMTTQENCSGSRCKPVGLDVTVLASPAFRRAYEGVYSPSGGSIAFVRNVRGRPVIYLAGVTAGPVRLIAGSQPDWQPVPAASN